MSIDRARRLRERAVLGSAPQAAVAEQARGGGGGLRFSAAQAPFRAPADAESPDAVRAVALHYTVVDPAKWPARHFSAQELASRSDGLVYVRAEALGALERLRDQVGRPLIVTSGYRSPEHNASVGGARASKHTLGHAFDISMANFRSVADIKAFRDAARRAGFTAVVDYPGSNFVHIDMRRSGALSWSSGGAAIGTTDDPGFAGDAWARAIEDEDGRVEQATTATVEKAETAATAAAGTIAASALAPTAEQADGMLSIVLKLLPYGPAAVGAVFGGYLLLKYGNLLWFRLSRFFQRSRAS